MEWLVIALIVTAMILSVITGIVLGFALARYTREHSGICPICGSMTPDDDPQTSKIT